MVRLLCGEEPKGLVGRCVVSSIGVRTVCAECNEAHTNVFNLYAPCVLYIGQAFRYSPENAFYIFNQQIYFII